MRANAEATRYVLDSSAIIALVRGEPGADMVSAAIGESLISAVNLTETLTKLIRRGGEPKLVERYLRALPFEIVAWDEELAWESLDLSPLAWTHGISLADRACMTLARHSDLPVMTTDATWTSLKIGIRVVLIRKPHA